MSEAPSGFVRAYPPAGPVSGPALHLMFQNGEMIVQDRDDAIVLIETSGLPPGWPAGEPLYLGTLDGRPVIADDYPEGTALQTGWRALGLRALYDQVPEKEYTLAGYAAQILYWRRTSKFCPVCGHATEAKGSDWGRKCPQCGHVGYPRISPAVLILVHREDKILLGHKPGWGTRYSILAGFVEPNESLEDCVRREVMEEAGLTVSDVMYTGSQAWPFPHQVMIGFTARYAGGTVQADEDELDDARWFDTATLPDLPPSISLSRQMIDAWVAEHS